MELFEKILVKHFAENNNIDFSVLEIEKKEILDLFSYNALLKIRRILEDITINDEEKLIKIEKIYNDFEFI